MQLFHWVVRPYETPALVCISVIPEHNKLPAFHNRARSSYVPARKHRSAMLGGDGVSAKQSCYRSKRAEKFRDKQKECNNRRCGKDFSVRAAKIGEKQSRQSNSKYNFMQYVYFFRKRYTQCTMGSAPEVGEFSRFFCVLKVTLQL